MAVRKTTGGKKVIHFVYERETKNKVRFDEPHEPGIMPNIGKLYVLRETYESIGSPQHLTVTLEESK